MKKIFLFLLLNINIFLAQTPRAGGINNIQATVLNTVHDNFVGVQTTNLNAFAVYNFSTNFDYYLGLKNTDNIPEGSINKYFSVTLARNSFSAGTGLIYSAGVYGLDSATQGTLASVSGKYSIPTGLITEYIRGDGSIAPFPTIPSAQVNSDWNSVSGVSRILNKPTIPTDNNQLVNGSGYITASSTNTLTNKSGNISQWTNDSGYLLNTRTLTINGTTFDLSANRTWTVGDVTTATLTSSLATKENTITAGTTAQYWRGDKTWQTLNTTAVPEGTNLYYTDSRARSSISLTTTGSGAASYSGGVLNIPTPSIPNDYTNTVAISGGAGNAVFYLTSDKTSTGTALYTTVTYVNPIVNDSTVNYSYGWSYNAGTKALTVNTRAAVGINVALVGLTLLGVPSPVANGTNVSVLVKGN